MGDTCSVYLQRTTPQRVGTLRLNHVRGKLASVFSYAAEWLQAPQTFTLSPDLPLDPYPKTCEGLFLCFQDCSPDRWGKALLRRQESARASGLRKFSSTTWRGKMFCLCNASTVGAWIVFRSSRP